MAAPAGLILEDRSILAVSGEDRVTFLQGLVSNDIRNVTASRAVYAALLTPQGKYLGDFFVIAAGDALWLDCEAARADPLARRMSIYRLRARVTIAPPAEALVIVAVFGTGAEAALGLEGFGIGTAVALPGGAAFLDPRLAAAGVRCVLPACDAAAFFATKGLVPARREEFERHRLTHGLPDGSRDLMIERSLPLECGFDELHGVDWHKGCYVGQEVTARTRHRGLIRKRLLPVRLSGPLPPPGTPIRQAERDAGEIRSGAHDLALALLHLDALAAWRSGGSGSDLWAAETKLVPVIPQWVQLPEQQRHPGAKS